MTAAPQSQPAAATQPAPATRPGKSAPQKTPAQLAEERSRWEEMRSHVPVGARGLEFADWNQLSAFCQTVAQGTLVPPDCRNSAANCLIKAQMGQALGLDAMTSIWNIDVIEGRPSLPVRLKLALCRRSRFFDETAWNIEYTGTPYEDDYTCTVTVRRKPDGEPHQGQFSVADAKRAGLWEKKSATGKPLPWMTYPRDMMFSRACGRALDREFSDILLGIYTKEDQEVDRLMDAVDLTARPMTHEQAIQALSIDPTIPIEDEQYGEDQPQEEEQPAQPAQPEAPASQPAGEQASVPTPAPSPAPSPAPAANDKLLQVNAYNKVRAAFMGLAGPAKTSARNRLGIQMVTDMRSWPLERLEEALDLLSS